MKAKRTRASLVVKNTELKSVIEKLESEQSFATQADLWIAVSNTEWGKAVQNTKHKVKGISPAMVYAKVREYKIEVKTVKGKRGGTANAARSARKDKLNKDGTMDLVITKIKKHWPEISESNIDRLKNGSMRTAIKIHCLQCAGCEGQHKQCNVTDCAFLPFNKLFWPRKEKKIKPEIKKQEKTVVKLDLDFSNL